MTRQTKPRFYMAAIFMLSMLGALFVPTQTNAGLTIFPLKIIMEEKDRFTEVHIFNTSKEKNSYKLGWRFQKQLPTGGYENVDSSTTPEFDLTKHMVYTPRRVTLQPNGRQTVRLAIRRAGDVPAGEYRAHLLIQTFEEEQANQNQKKDVEGATTVVKVFPGYTIPIIYRVGAYDAAVSISNVRYDPASNGKKLLLTLNRSGAHGTVGNLRAYHVVKGKDPVEVGLKNNVNIFAETTTRNANIMMTETGFSGGHLRIVYNGEGPQKDKVIAETYIPLAN